MKNWMNKFRSSMVAISALGLLAAQTALAHDSSRMSKGSSHNSQSGNSHVIAAPNGNTGFSGIGLPKALDTGKDGKHKGKDLTGGNGSMSQVIPAANGNTGFSGIGLPKNEGKAQFNSASKSLSSLGIFSQLTSTAGNVAAVANPQGFSPAAHPIFQTDPSHKLQSGGPALHADPKLKLEQFSPVETLSSDLGLLIPGRDNKLVLIPTLPADPYLKLRDQQNWSSTQLENWGE
jgi:hypothetical protein